MLCHNQSRRSPEARRHDPPITVVAARLMLFSAKTLLVPERHLVTNAETDNVDIQRRLAINADSRCNQKCSSYIGSTPYVHITRLSCRRKTDVVKITVPANRVFEKWFQN